MRRNETVLELDLRNLEQNYLFLRSRLRPGTRFLGVVKAYGYGSEAAAVALELEKLGADYLAVAYTKEGVALRKSGVQLPILVLHPQPSGMAAIIRHRLEPSLYSQRIMDEFIHAARTNGEMGYPVHLKFNTGLNRLGFTAKDIPLLLNILDNSNELHVVTVFSHLVASEDLTESSFTQGQIQKFDGIAKEMEAGLGYRPILHLANTSGTLNYPEAHYDMVRCGIGLYGFGNDPRFSERLIPIATLKTTISQIHPIAVGESVGYNRGFMPSRPMIIATLPLGHADGIGRQYGHGAGQVTIMGRKAPIVGNVCMDMIMVDVTDIPCQEGDEVIVFGKSPNAEQFAAGAGTISYELITGISQRVQRMVVVD